MKMSMAGMVAAGVLMFLAGSGFGIAQAGGNHTDTPAYGYEGQELLQVVNAPEEDVDLQGPIGVGTLPSGNNMDIDDTDSRDQGE